MNINFALKDIFGWIINLKWTFSCCQISKLPRKLDEEFEGGGWVLKTNPIASRVCQNIFSQKTTSVKLEEIEQKFLKTIKKKTYLHKEVNVQFHYVFYLEGAGWAGSRTAYFSGCIFSVLLSWVNAIKVQADAIESWANAIEVWANDIKIQGQH